MDNNNESKKIILPPEVQASIDGERKKEAAAEKKTLLEYEGYSYYISGDDKKELRKTPINGGEAIVLHSFTGKYGSESGWHREDARALVIEKVSDGFVYYYDSEYGSNDWSEWDNTDFYKIKTDGTGKPIRYKRNKYKVAPDGEENDTTYWDDDGNPVRLESNDQKEK